MPEVNLRRKVGYDVRVYEDAFGVHKMGWLRQGDIVRLIEEYDGWYQIDYDESDTVDLVAPDAQYHEYWVEDRPDGLFLAVDAPVPEPDNPGCLGTIVDFITGILKKVTGQ